MARRALLFASIFMAGVACGGGAEAPEGGAPLASTDASFQGDEKSPDAAAHVIPTSDASETGTAFGGPAADVAIDGASDGSVHGDAPAGCTATLCEDFERSSGLDPALWTTTTMGSGSTAAADSVQAHGGTRAAHFHLEPNGNTALIGETMTAATLGSHLFGRAFFYADYDTSRGHALFITAGNFNNKHLEIGQSHGNWQLTAWGPGKEYPAGYDTTVPLKTWSCLEWEMIKATGEMHLYLEGTEVAHYPGQAGTANWTDFTEVDFGFHPFSTSTAPSDIFFDDIRLDSERIGCQ